MTAPSTPVRLHTVQVGPADGDRTAPVALFAAPGSPAGRELAAAEAIAFAEAPAIFPADDPTFVMLGIVIDGSVHHVMRLSVTTAEVSGEVPFYVRDLADSQQGITLPQCLRFYGEQGIDLDRSVSVETNSRLGDRIDGPSTADIAYLAVFDVVMRTNATAVFAHLNEAARRSFQRVGLVGEPFLGDPDLRTPGAESGTYDDNYKPVCLPVNEVNVGVFAALEGFRPSVQWASELPSWWAPGPT